MFRGWDFNAGTCPESLFAWPPESWKYYLDVRHIMVQSTRSQSWRLMSFTNYKYRTPSGEIFGHSRSRSHCFQVQSVTWCWGPWLFLWVWSIFHILLSKGMVTLRKFLEFQLVIPQTLICNRNRFCTQSISLNHSVADLLAPRLGEICNLLCVSLHWDQTWTYRWVDRYQIFTPILQWRLRMTWMRSGLQDPVLPRSVRVNGLSANLDWCFGKCPYFYYSR